jgi:hypothetical protein
MGQGNRFVTDCTKGKLAIIRTRQGSLAYIDHDSLFAHLLQSERCTDCAPIEFNGAANSVHAAAENDDSVVVERNIMSCCIISCVLKVEKLVTSFL